ncbi:hypothetical protein [Actinoplanes derwentensis]|uniref:Uncharacterized protein n=1 Tax=Actinoplanes derwentensis TaxID=113562 RepID=A0A1H2DF50_9ACTN|nr:hypothetical protein [Actinoplanes derwentensis]GID84734.1 hypothetical protein Ade03nite_36580 [Actinoplanes derwentensis]SDT81217.1 hypothetical protein SAMN04489716_9543 [Actinoplanes derwentensis]
MNSRPTARGAVLLAALVTVPGLLTMGPTPVWAAPSSVVMAAAAVDPAAADLIYVTHLALYDTRALVRVAARNAITVEARLVKAAVARFLKSELPFAVSYSRELNAANADFAERILATHTPEFAPEVHAAAQFALSRGAAALDAFAKTGYEQAKLRDRAAREAVGEQAAALRAEDRAFVARLRDTDPGMNVRAAAGLAVGADGSDADVVEFFAYDWAAAAAVDLEILKVRCADADMVGRANLTQLETNARNAEKAALAAADEAKAQKLAVAARAWELVGGQAEPMAGTWDEAERVATEQAAHWRQIAVDAAAAATDNPNWAAVAGSAQTTAQQWLIERDNAAGRAAFWADRYEEALAGELRMQP